MNRTKIEWTEFTWNPLTGCWGPGGTAEKPNRCPYCYARSIARRFYGGFPPGDAFAPLFMASKLEEPKARRKPAKIFVCSMGDLFGDWVPKEWIEAVLAVVKDCPQHTFQFLTKNPARYAEFNPWPENAWVGATATDQSSFRQAIKHLNEVDAQGIRFISCEPLLGEIHPTEGLGWPLKEFIQLLIIGAQTGPGAKPVNRHHVHIILEELRSWKGRNVAVFLKNNLNWPEKIQEFPL